MQEGIFCSAAVTTAYEVKIEIAVSHKFSLLFYLCQPCSERKYPLLTISVLNYFYIYDLIFSELGVVLQKLFKNLTTSVFFFSLCCYSNPSVYF